MTGKEISSLIHTVERENHTLLDGSFDEGVAWALDLVQHLLEKKLIQNDELESYLMKELEKPDKVIKIDRSKVEDPYMLEVEANKICMHIELIKKVEVEKDFLLIYK